MKKLITLLLIIGIFLSGCNTSRKEEEEILVNVENPSTTLELFSNAINDFDVETALSCIEISDKEKEIVNQKAEELLKIPLFKGIYQSAIYTNIKEIKSEEIDNNKAKVIAIISIETIKNLGETATDIISEIIEEGTKYDENQIKSLVIDEISKIDISKKEVVDLEITFNMILQDEKWIISKENGIIINEKSITINDK